MSVHWDYTIWAAEPALGTAVSSHLLVPCHSSENIQHLSTNISSPLNLKMNISYHSCFWEWETRVGGQQETKQNCNKNKIVIKINP